MAATVICPACSKNCTARQASIECGHCKSWFHRKCTGLTDKEFNFLNEGNKNGKDQRTYIKWYCRSCDTQEPFTDIEKLLRYISDMHYKHIELVCELKKLNEEKKSGPSQVVSHATENGERDVEDEDTIPVITANVEAAVTADNIKQQVTPIEIKASITKCITKKTGELLIKCKDKVSTDKVKETVQQVW
jgi:hypothetical protein